MPTPQTDQKPTFWANLLKWKTMNFKNFRFNVFVRVLLLTATVFVFTFLYSQTGYTATNIGVGLLIIFQIVRLIKQVEATNEEVVNFLNSIRYDDFSNTYRLSQEGQTFEDLNMAFDNVVRKFKDIRAEKEANLQYFKTIVQHIGVGIVAFDTEGNVQLLNSTAKRLLKTNKLAKITDLYLYSVDLVDALQKLRNGDKILVRIILKDEILQLAVYMMEVALQGKEYRLATLQNIRAELEDQELEAWQRIIRVLNHEIMNAITPISSLTKTVEQEIDYLQEQAEKGLRAEDFEDVSLALRTIERRSDNLVRFVNDFRNLTYINEPKFKNWKITDLFEEVLKLFEIEFVRHEIRYEISVEPESLLITADKELIIQILINLVNNALYAVLSLDSEKTKLIELVAYQDERSRPTLIVRDNGIGIDSDALERIFIPFFSTKQLSSGIGLSVSRQIMRMHNGTITAYSEKQKGTEFVLKF